MCDMLMSIKDSSLLKQIEKDCTAISDAMLSFPFMIPGTRYFKGIKVGLSTNAVYIMACNISEKKLPTMKSKWDLSKQIINYQKGVDN